MDLSKVTKDDIKKLAGYFYNTNAKDQDLNLIHDAYMTGFDQCFELLKSDQWKKPSQQKLVFGEMVLIIHADSRLDVARYEGPIKYVIGNGDVVQDVTLQHKLPGSMSEDETLKQLFLENLKNVQPGGSISFKLSSVLTDVFVKNAVIRKANEIKCSTKSNEDYSSRLKTISFELE